jgi:hypothetical protein
MQEHHEAGIHVVLLVVNCTRANELQTIPRLDHATKGIRLSKSDGYSLDRTYERRSITLLCDRQLEVSRGKLTKGEFSVATGK